MTRERGRPPEGERVELRLTAAQIEWLDRQAGVWLGLHGVSRAARVRAIVELAMWLGLHGVSLAAIKAAATLQAEADANGWGES